MNAPSSPLISTESFRAAFEKTGSIEMAAVAFFEQYVRYGRADLMAASRQLKADLLANPGPWHTTAHPDGSPALTLDSTFIITQAYGHVAGGSARQYAELAQLFTDFHAPTFGRAMTLGSAALASQPAGTEPPSPAPVAAPIPRMSR